MADAVHSTTAPIIPFPLDRARAPDQLHRAIDDWNRTRNVALAACIFRGMNDGDAATTVRKMIMEGGAQAVALLLEETGRAIRRCAASSTNSSTSMGSSPQPLIACSRRPAIDRPA